MDRNNRPQGPSMQSLEALHNPSNGPGYDEEELSSTKIPPLDSPVKEHFGHEHTHGVIGEDYILQSTHLEPLPHESKMGPSQQGGHHVAHHQRRDQREQHHRGDQQHHEEYHQQGQQQQQQKRGKAKQMMEEGHHEGSMGMGTKSQGQKMGEGQKMSSQKMRQGGTQGSSVREKVADHGKGGMPMSE